MLPRWSRDPGRNAYLAEPGLAARSAPRITDYLDCCAGPALAARSALRSTDYLVCCAGPALAALPVLRSTDYLACCARPALVARLALHCTDYLVCCDGQALPAVCWVGQSSRLGRHPAARTHLAPPTALAARRPTGFLSSANARGLGPAHTHQTHDTHYTPQRTHPGLPKRGQAMPGYGPPLII